jgi:hypothetical protein
METIGQLKRDGLYCKLSILELRSTRNCVLSMHAIRSLRSYYYRHRVRTVAQDMAVEIMITKTYKIDRIAEVDFRAPIEQ